MEARYGWSVAEGDESVFLGVAPYRSAHGRDSRSRVYRARANMPWQPCTGEFPSLPRLRAVGGHVFAALGDRTLVGSADEGDSWRRLPVKLGSASRALLALAAT